MNAPLDEKVAPIYQEVLARNPGETEFHQAVQEVLESLGPVVVKHVITSYSIHYTKLYEPIHEGDLLVIQDTGAHGYAMGFQYNGRLRPKELLLRSDGSIELIRREETVDDYLRTLDFTADVLV